MSVVSILGRWTIKKVFHVRQLPVLESCPFKTIVFFLKLVSTKRAVPLREVSCLIEVTSSEWRGQLKVFDEGVPLNSYQIEGNSHQREELIERQLLKTVWRGCAPELMSVFAHASHSTQPVTNDSAQEELEPPRTEKFSPP